MGVSSENETFQRVMERMRRLRAQISHVDSTEATVAAGADAYIGRGVFTGKHEVRVGDSTLRFRKAVIATGARGSVPPIPGLKDVPFLTNATVFNLENLPPRFVVLGAGPIGLEMAQAFRRFGSQVTVLEGLPRILGPEDADASAVIHKVLEKEGVRVLTGLQVQSVSFVEGRQFPTISVTVCEKGREPEVVDCDALLIATGRAPNVENVGFEAAGVEFDPRLGVKVQDDLRTTNPDIFAVGDVIDKPSLRFTHMAGTGAGIVVQNALFEDCGLPVNAPSNKLSDIIVPRCTYTEPEVASCGCSNAQSAATAGVEFDTYTAGVAHNDRNILEGGNPDGFVRILCKKDTDEILGATIVAEHAGEMLAEITLAIQHGIGLSAIARTVHPYPTLGEAIQQCALNYNRARWVKMGEQQRYKEARTQQLAREQAERASILEQQRPQQLCWFAGNRRSNRRTG